MATTKLRLEIHRITLQKLVKGRKGSTYKNCNFSNLLESFDKDKQKAFPLLWAQFVDYFQGQFLMNKDKDKAITATSACKKFFSSTKNTISGEINGGPTNREQAIFKRKNSKSSTGIVADDDVVSSNFFIKLWLPYDYTTGVLMIQSYSNATVSDLVKLHFAKFVQQKGFKLLVTSYYPESFLKERNKSSNVVSVTYVKDRLSKEKRSQLNPLFAEFDDLKIRIVVTGFRKSVSDFWGKFSNNGRPLNTDIDPLEMKSQDENQVIAVYEDEEGHQTTMNFDQKRLRDFAYCTLPESVILKGKNTFDFEAIRKHTDDVLEKVKKEINYLKK